ncbi:MAG: T9SS type A sorting domain-containing protein [Bacteroidetes bacterium]|nr:T9SS type A sorting domain-containing protein [Bacteroidota bacterium]
MNLLKRISFIGFCISFFMITQSVNAQSVQIPAVSPDFKVFPNPNQVDADTFVSLDGFKADNLLVVVYDMLGREIYSKVEIMENGGFLFTVTSDGHQLPSGIFLITAAANDRIFHQKLIVK